MVSEAEAVESKRRIAASVLALAIATAILLSTAPPLAAEVVRMEITSRESFAGGEEFGDVGAYEIIRGRLHYAVDPTDPANIRIVDIGLAPRNAEGQVEFAGDFVLIKPVDLSRGNHRLLYDVNNRGNLVMIGSCNGVWGNDPGAGNGFLMRRGYSLLWSAWNWDVLPGAGRLQIELPVATENGKPIEQKIAAEIVLSFETEKVQSQPLAWGNSRCYPPVDASNDSDAVLTVRDSPRGERMPIARDQWRFARLENDEVVPDPTSLFLESGFEPGRIYELIYTVRDPKVVGLGLAAVRDSISFFRFDTEDSEGNANPLTVDAEAGTKPDSEYAYIYGVSQSGRFITHMIWQGFHVDEAGRMIFEGARIHVPGGGKGGFNHRFAQTTHHPSHLEGNYMPADHPPFNYLPDDDPGFGGENDVLALAKRMGKVPLIMVTNNALEYWTRSASLIHTDVEGKRDMPVHPNVRIYVTNSAPHRGVRNIESPIYEHTVNPIDVSPVLRALLVAMDRWVSEGAAPPPSAYPRIERGELITAAEHAARFPAIPGMRHPGVNLRPPRVDYGPRFWSEGIIDVVPPAMGEPYATLVAAFDSDGNDIGGIRLPELRVPLGTYQGWNARKAEFGAGDFLGRFEGSFWPFALTEAEREQSGDPRPSIGSRYADREAYIEEIREAVGELVEQGFMLKEDADIYREDAVGMAWPPQLQMQKPFWKRAEER